ncbi:MAG: zinc ribbon domain-containing protein [Burkholderiaceae bacterium]|nr:zinc ribbon domain-containing protein [Burkholderiaceae bacterium]MEB2350265.1 zinc ribbon domain-containing protein [Burkholderiaceae bacterium]
MPIYAYRCDHCGVEKDVLQKLSDAPLAVCPDCGAEAFHKRLSAPAFQLKGSGWYVTDFRDGGRKGAPDAKPSDGKADAAADSGKADSAKADSGKTDSAKTEPDGGRNAEGAGAGAGPPGAPAAPVAGASAAGAKQG